jgi:hypothetical protein
MVNYYNGYLVKTELFRTLKILVLIMMTYNIQSQAMFGEILYPDDDSNHKVPGVVLLGGSNGKLLESSAKFLASKGFAAFALPYFYFPS